MLLCGYFRNKKPRLIIKLIRYFPKHLVLVMDTEGVYFEVGNEFLCAR